MSSHPTAAIESHSSVAHALHNASISSASVSVKKLRPTAETPFAGDGDVGFVITLCERAEGRVEDNELDINVFGTGLHVNVPAGYYVMLHGLPELLRRGYW